jgi:hypothetical protein
MDFIADLRRLDIWDAQFLEFLPWWAWIAIAAVAAVVILPRMPGPRGLVALAVLVAVAALAAGDAAEKFFPQVEDMKLEFALAALAGALLLIGMAAAKAWTRMMLLALSAVGILAMAAAVWYRFYGVKIIKGAL